jgi:hypothetical protein
MSMQSMKMNPGPTARRSSWISLALLACVGCGASNPADVEQVADDVPDMSALVPPGHPIALEVFVDDVGDRAATQTRALIRTLRGYEDFFGHAPPAGIDFAREWVIFYAAGTKPTGGYVASILSLTRSGGAVTAVTQLASPGADCVTTQSLTSPHVLVRFAAQPGSAMAFRKKNVTRSCDASKCAAVLCAVGSTCDPATGACVPGPDAVRCGGFSGAACPGSGRCVDDPSDSCDPGAGGADCGGICQCIENVACTKDTTFDSSPGVCACVPAPPQCGPVCDIFCEYGNVLDAAGCPTCQCKPAPADPCAGVKCATGTHCAAVEAPCVANVACPPVAACVPDKKTTTCGGIAGIPCPGAGKCVDDPGDGCDPSAGGADCGGICQCVQNVLCTKDAVFDSSPGVCACVTPPQQCGPVCAIYCEYGNVTDANGCPTCQCNPAPAADPCATVRCAAGTHCEAQQVICKKAPCPPVGACVPDKKSVSCGGFAGIPCPGGGKCVDDPSDSCDPSAGGADCGGICQCVQTVQCTTTARFDSSPEVCACVPLR